MFSLSEHTFSVLTTLSRRKNHLQQLFQWLLRPSPFKRRSYFFKSPQAFYWEQTWISLSGKFSLSFQYVFIEFILQRCLPSVCEALYSNSVLKKVTSYLWELNVLKYSKHLEEYLAAAVMIQMLTRKNNKVTRWKRPVIWNKVIKEELTKLRGFICSTVFKTERAERKGPEQKSAWDIKDCICELCRKLESSERKDPQLRKCLHEIQCGAFSGLVISRGEFSPWWMGPSLNRRYWVL